MYSNKNSASHTICTSGCGPSSMAMVIATYSNRAITPVETAKYAVDHGMKDDSVGTYWSFFPKIAAAYGLNCKQISCSGNMNYIKTQINAGALGIASMGPGQWTKGGHFIAVNSFDGNYVYAHDPNYRSGKSDHQAISSFESECKQFWLFTKK